MTRAHILTLSVLSLTSLAAGCGPPWTVVRQSVPSPLLNQRAFAAEPMHFETLRVGRKAEPEYLSGKNEKQVASWQADKDAMVNKFYEVLAGSVAPGIQVTPLQPGQGVPPGMFIIRVICQRIEPGSFNGFVNLQSDMSIAVQLLDPAGNVLEEMATRTAEAATIVNPSSGGRMRTMAQRLGSIAGRYVQSRVFPQQ